MRNFYQYDDFEDLSQEKKIERWENVKRVLSGLDEHEREKHWSMAVWGTKNDCGTIACAAGHCGLDPWFRERGFKLDFFPNSDLPRIGNVDRFFGVRGTGRIFLNTNPRSVEWVIKEVEAYIQQLKAVQ